jgi:DNA helicase-2/ATP-dependent DNA helicase PcrA
MGVAAVPGSGKTEVLSALAARLVSTQLQDDQEVLVVTLVNSAVDNFAGRIRRFLREEYRLLAGVGYRVRTLHGLCHDIVRERPSLVGLADDFAIADERESLSILEDAVDSGLRLHHGLQQAYCDSELDERQTSYVKRERWPELMRDVASGFIRRAKDRRWSPELLSSWLTARDDTWLLARFCSDVYADYQRSLSYRGKVDFDDLVKHAITALQIDSDYLKRLQSLWPFVLEDEAQDSSALQQDLLALLTGPNGNWVRVGDANQAVYQTFTTADPELLRAFLASSDVRTVEMAESGRSGPPIVETANYLVDWAVGKHPLQDARSAFRSQHIELTRANDPQPNPPTEECRVHFYPRGLTPEAEVRTVVASLSRWVPQHPESTVAILVPDNDRGFKFANALRQKGLDCLELLNSSSPTRQTAEILANVCRHLADPDHPPRLVGAFEAWLWEERREREQRDTLRRIGPRLKGCRHVEDYLWPRLGVNWLDEQGSDDEDQRDLLLSFRTVVQRWHGAVSLPIDQLILTIAQDLFREPADLARAYHFAVALRDLADANPQWRLKQLAEELRVVARNQRRFVSVSAEDTGFDPSRHPGRVVVATMHRAKGLEWDRVHLTSVNNYDFPSGSELDSYRGEPWFIRDDLNMVAEALGRLEALPLSEQSYEEGEQSQWAREDYIRERLRLLYVGITRAKRELIVTWNTGRHKVQPQQPALAFTVLRTYLEQRALQASDEGEQEAVDEAT